jgi:hypothetical protein
VECYGWRRTDGLWDIEGHLTDTKTYAIHNDDRGNILPGEPIHEMWLRLTLDDCFRIIAIKAVTSHAPYRVCSAITPVFQELVGLYVTAGFIKQVKDRIGGVRGCTHLIELFGPVATTAFQTIFPVLAYEQGVKVERGSNNTQDLPVLLDMCHAFARDGELVRKHWPEYYAPPKANTQSIAIEE